MTADKTADQSPPRYGPSDLRRAYFYWWLRDQCERLHRQALLLRSPERDDEADPPIIVEAPCLTPNL